MTIQHFNTQKKYKEVFRFTDKICAIDFGNVSPENDKKIMDLSTAIIKASKSIDRRQNAPSLENSIVKFSREALAQKFTEKMDYSQLCDFHKRIWEVWKQTGFDWTKDLEFGKHFLENHSESLIVTKAIQKECQWRMTRAILKYLSEGQIDNAKELFFHLPIKEQWAIERRIWQTWTKKTVQETDDPVFGKHYLDTCFQEKRADAIVIEAFDTYLQGSLNTSAGIFFKIKDSEGKTWGYLLGTFHLAPVEFLKFRPEIQKAFAKCNAFFPEIDISHYCTHKIVAKQLTSQFGQQLLCSMDLKLTEKAKTMGKQVIGLEDESDHFQVLRTLESFVIEEWGRHTLKLPTVAESWQCWEKGSGSSNELSQRLHRFAQYFLEVDKHKGLSVLQHLHTDRNIKMSAQMDKVLNEKSLLPFFAVGSDHMSDHPEIGDGLISLMAKKGWSCVPA